MLPGKWNTKLIDGHFVVDWCLLGCHELPQGQDPVHWMPESWLCCDQPVASIPHIHNMSHGCRMQRLCKDRLYRAAAAGAAAVCSSHVPWLTAAMHFCMVVATLHTMLEPF
jgi:hypothetical protein